MLFGDFHYKLRRLNSDLWVDTERRNIVYHKDFAHAGLYNGDKYLFGVPQEYVPEYSIVGVDGGKINDAGFECSSFTGDSGQYFDLHFIERVQKEDAAALHERILARGYRATLAGLVKAGLVNKYKAERSFGCSIEENRVIFPKRYIDLGFTK